MFDVKRFSEALAMLFAFYPQYAPSGDDKAKAIVYEYWRKSLSCFTIEEIEKSIQLVIDNGVNNCGAKFFDGNLLALVRTSILKTRYCCTVATSFDLIDKMKSIFPKINTPIDSDEYRETYRQAKKWLEKQNEITAYLLFDVISWHEWLRSNSNVVRSNYIRMFNELQDKALFTGKFKPEIKQLPVDNTITLRLEQAA